MRFKDIMKIAVAIIMVSWLMGCASSNFNYFEDGKPLGKGNVSQGCGICIVPSIDYSLVNDTIPSPEVDIGSEFTTAPLVTFHIKKGLSEHLDVGGGIGLGIFSVNLRVFSKFSLLKKENNFGIGLIPAVNFSFTPDSIFGFMDVSHRVTNLNFYLSLPVSYDVSKHFSLIARPFYGFEHSWVSLEDEEDKKYNKTLGFEGQGIALGMKFKFKNPDQYIYPEFAIISYDQGCHYVPIVGVNLTGISVF